MKTHILPQSLISLLVLAAASAQAPTALAQQTNDSSEQKALRLQTVDSLDKQLAELEKAEKTTPASGSAALSVKAEVLARQYCNLGALPASGRAWALALKTSSDPFRQSAIYTQWSEQEVNSSPKHAAELKESAKAVGHGTKQVTTEIGHASRDTVKSIGKGTKKIVKDVAD